MPFKVLSSLFGIPEGEIERVIEEDLRVRNSLWLEALFNKELSPEELKKFPEDQIRTACGFVRDYGFLFEPNPNLTALCREDDRADQRYVRKFFEILELDLSNLSSISPSSRLDRGAF